MNLSSFIDFKNVSYRGILKNINLQIEKGEFISVIGSNGSGKSTLLKLLSGILIPSDGEVFINSQNTKNESGLYEIKKSVGMVFQNPDNQIIASTVEEEIAFGLENLCIPRREIKMKIKEVLETVGLRGFEKEMVENLSGGQKQKLNIASVIAMEPEIIVLDEPTSMLDPESKETIMNLILELNKNFGTTTLLVTHFMNEAFLSDKVILLGGGEIKKFEKPEEVFWNESCRNCLSPMDSAEILFFLKKLGYDVSKNKNAFETESCAREIINILKNGRKK